MVKTTNISRFKRQNDAFRAIYDQNNRQLLCFCVLDLTKMLKNIKTKQSLSNNVTV